MRLLGLVVISRCWRPVATPPVETPTNVVTVESPSGAPPRSRRPSSPYAEVVGTWKGVGYQYDTRGHWPLEMTLSARGEVDDVIGSIVYEDGGCTANLIRQPEEGDTLVMREKLVTGQGRCVDNGWIRIPRRPIAHELDWRWDFETRREGASSTLRRE